MGFEDTAMGRRKHKLGRWLAVALLVAVAGSLVVSCGDDNDGTITGDEAAGGGAADNGADGNGASGDGTRSVETEHGTVEVPVSPQRVVALDEYAALNALALGVEPVVVFASYQSEVGGAVLRSAEIDVQPGSAETGPNFEAVAAARPDLILFTTEGSLTSHVDQLSAIAPAVSLPYSSPWRDVIRDTAAVFGADERADELIGLLEGRIESLRSEIGDEPVSLSILADSLGMVFAVSMTSPLAHVVDEAGFTRPDSQLNGEPDPMFDSAIPISIETLDGHDADLVIVLSGAYYNAETLLDAPTFNALPAVSDGRSVVVDGDMWFGSYPFALWWLLDDLDALVAGDGQDGIGGPDDVSSRWAAFEAAQ